MALPGQARVGPNPARATGQNQGHRQSQEKGPVQGQESGNLGVQIHTIPPWSSVIPRTSSQCIMVLTTGPGIEELRGSSAGYW